MQTILLFNLPVSVLSLAQSNFISPQTPGGSSDKESICQFRRHKRHRFQGQISTFQLIKLSAMAWIKIYQLRLKKKKKKRETQVWSLGWENPLEEGMATYSRILAWRIPWTEEPGGLQCIGSRRVRHNWAQYSIVKNKHTHTHIGYTQT